MSAWFLPGAERVNAPSWLGAALIGPVRRSAYSSAIPALPRQLAASSFSVPPAVTFQTVRSCRWSCRLPPTAGRSASTSIAVPAEQRPRAEPRELQQLRAVHRPRASTTARRAAIRRPSTSSTPVQASPSGRRSSTSRATSAPVRTTRFRRPRAGRRKARAAFQRKPRALVHLEVADPLVVAVVEVGPRRDAGLAAGRGEGVEDRIARPLPLDPQLAVAAVEAGERPGRRRRPSASGSRGRRSRAAPAPTTTPGSPSSSAQPS